MWMQIAFDSTTHELVVQINGKLRGKLRFRATLTITTEHIALQDHHIRRAIGDKNVVKVIVVPGKLINIVVN